MNRIQPSVTSSSLTTGIVTVAANAALTLIRSDDAFHALMGVSRESCFASNSSLRTILGQDCSDEVYQLLADTRPRQTTREFYAQQVSGVRKKHLHLSVILIEDRLYAAMYPMYTIVFTDLSPLEDTAAATIQKETIFSRVITGLCEHVLDIDPVSGMYDLLSIRRERFLLFQKTGPYVTTLDAMALRYLDSSCRDEFWATFSLDAMTQSFDAGIRELEREYMLNVDGVVFWKVSLAFPCTLADGSRHIILCSRDITDFKRAEKNTKREEENFRRVLQNSYAAIYEVDLQTQTFRVVHSDSGRTALLKRAHCGIEDNCPLSDTCVHPDDRKLFLHHYDIANIREALASGTELSAEYRTQSEGDQYSWTASIILPMIENSDKTLILCRDITRQKQFEEQHRFEAQRFNTALRNVYTEIYEIDLLANMPHLLFSSSAVLIPVDSDKTADIHTIASTLIHPDDRGHFIQNFIGDNVRNCFAQGHEEVPEEYRRLGYDGTYSWVSASIVPLRNSKDEDPRRGLMLIRDISDRKAQEQQQRLVEQYDLALRNIYDELYELNITQGTYRLVYHAQNKYVTPADAGALDAGLCEVSECMIHPDDKERFLQFFSLDAVRANFAAGREYLIGEFRKLWLDGTYHWASLTMFPVGASASNNEIYLVFIMDIGEKKKLEQLTQQNLFLEHQRLADERYRIIIDQTDTLVFEWIRESSRRFVSPEIPKRFVGNYNGRNLMHIWRDDKVIHPEDLPLQTEFLKKIYAGSSNAEMTVRFCTHEGQYIWCKVALACLRDEQGEPKRYIGTLNNVDEATRSVMALKYRAEYDTLTGIYNMQTFYTKAAQAIHEHPERHYSIIRMDIDRFKVINDLYGIREGDRLLCAIAQLLGEKKFAHDVYGRISGDIFCVCTSRDKRDLIAVVDDIKERLTAYPLAYRIMPSFGICTVDNSDTPINVLCDWANLALKTIKGSYITSYAFYDDKLRQKLLDEKKIESEMYNALQSGQFTMYLQPKVHIPTSEIIGAEALVRWIHPEQGLVPPDSFIPLFEKDGFIIQLDEYIWEQACITLRKWLDTGQVPVPLSVNVSRMHIHDAHFCDKLLKLITKYALPPSLLKLELTESAFLENETGLLATMNNLQAHEFLFSMDDFGSGYSSLNMLKSLPINTIKIDRGFLSEVVATERGKTIIRHIIAMARQMDIGVIAEGVETVEHAVFLLESGCFLAQGYFYSCPLPVHNFEVLAYGGLTPPFLVPHEIQDLVARESCCTFTKISDTPC